MTSHALKRGSRRFSLNETGFLLDPVITAWAARVVINGGAQPSLSTQIVLNDFYRGLVFNGLISKMIAINCLVPDNLIACQTPLIKGSGNDPWINHSIISTDLTVNGIKFDATPKWMDTGLIPTTLFPDDTSGGITLYTHDGNVSSASANDFGAASGGFTNDFSLILSQSGTTFFECFGVGAGSFASFASGNFQGYTSGNRTATNAIALYQANSATSHSAVNTASGASGTRPGVPCYFGTINNGGTPNGFSLQRFSFAAAHRGLIASESLLLFQAVQTMRVSLGGGYV